MSSPKREMTRAANIEKIKVTAKKLLARDGATGLSLREVAREMGQTSSALYRYFANRDELLTALIVDAYNELGEATERAESRVARDDVRGRWRATCRCVRRWARAHPHEYALIFGSPVPGYEAPQLTVTAATRVTAVMAGVVVDHFRQGSSAATPDPRMDRALLVENVTAFMPGVPLDAALRSVFAWTQIFGFISFELFGHLVGTVRQSDVAFDLLIDQTGDTVGLAGAVT